jgi:hypothetical protein
MYIHFKISSNLAIIIKSNQLFKAFDDYLIYLFIMVFIKLI